MTPFTFIFSPSLRYTSLPEATVLCLGNFDGVHLAHRTLLRTGRALRDEQLPHAACGVFCFRGLSSDVLQAEPPSHLCTEEQRISRFFEEGMDFVCIADFPSVMDMEAERFIADVLKKECHAQALICGFNYRFGRGGSGTPDTLRNSFDGTVHVAPPVTWEGSPVSSTRIRASLAKGDVETATRLLTRPYGFSASVLHGKKLGRVLGFPTINQAVPAKMLIPPHGVYVTDCTVDGTIFRGVTNVGVHPTVDRDAEVNCETFLLDFEGDVYEKEIELSFLKRLRPEQKFESTEALCAQILCDVEAAKKFK